jgi:hypothetical protein
MKKNTPGKKKYKSSEQETIGQYENWREAYDISKNLEEHIGQAEKRTELLYANYLRQAKFSNLITNSFFILCSITALILIGFGLYFAFQTNASQFHLLSIGMLGGGILLFLILIFRNPQKRASRSLTELIKIEVIFTGYMRQIYLIDAQSRQLLSSTGYSDVNTLNSLAEQIQNTVDQTVDSFAASLEEIL